MELSKRKRAVLAAVIKAYINTGEPVGSKVLTGLIENAPSSATLRNEMNELCNLGFLNQPHTSAGRVPTNNGYRLYVEKLMSPSLISKSAKNFIDIRLENIHCDPEKIPLIAADIISDLTGLPAVTCFQSENLTVINRVEILQITHNSVMILLITSDGRTRSSIFRMGTYFSAELVNKFYLIVQKKIIGHSANDLTKAYMQSVIASSGIDSLNLLPLLSALFEMASNIETSSVYLTGDDFLYNICPDEETSRRIRRFIERKEPIFKMIESLPCNSGVIFGSETEFDEFKNGILIVSKYKSSDSCKRSIGVIGPSRVSYDLIIPSVEYISSKLKTIMTEAQKDMED